MYPSVGKENSKELLKALRAVSKKTDTGIAKKVLAKHENRDSEACELAHEVFSEALDEYRTGAMEWEAMVDDMCKTLKAIKPENLKSMDDEDEDTETK
jgi:hypothetical protein